MKTYKMRNGTEISVKMLKHWELLSRSEQEIADMLGISRVGLLRIRKALGYRRPYRSDKGTFRVDPEEKRLRWNAYMRDYYHKKRKLSGNLYVNVGGEVKRVLRSRYNATLYILNRPLTDEEVVHHIDGNPENNSPDNLLVFASDADHEAYHRGEDVKPVTE